MVKKQIDYDKINESNLLVHKTGNSIRIKFLDEGTIDTMEITDKDTNETKTIEKYVYQVLDLSDNKQKEYSSLSTRFVLEAKKYIPLKNKSFSILKYQFGTNPKFDIDYEFTIIK